MTHALRLLIYLNANVLSSGGAILPTQVAVNPPEKAVIEDICGNCSIRLEVLAEIDRRREPSLSDQAVIVVGPDDQIVLIDPVGHLGRLLQYDSLGRFERSFSLGQIQNPAAPVFNHRGELVLIDERSGRSQIIDSTGSIRSTFTTLEYILGTTFLPSGRLVINAQPAAPDRHRFALHTLIPGNPMVLSMDRFEGRESSLVGLMVSSSGGVSGLGTQMNGGPHT
jgi:hypothetical protein